MGEPYMAPGSGTPGAGPSGAIGFGEVLARGAIGFELGDGWYGDPAYGLPVTPYIPDGAANGAAGAGATSAGNDPGANDSATVEVDIAGAWVGEIESVESVEFGEVGGVGGFAVEVWLDAPAAPPQAGGKNESTGAIARGFPGDELPAAVEPSCVVGEVGVPVAVVSISRGVAVSAAHAAIPSTAAGFLSDWSYCARCCGSSRQRFAVESRSNNDAH